MDIIDSVPSQVVPIGVQEETNHEARSKRNGSLRSMKTGFCDVFKEHHSCQCNSSQIEKSETGTTVSLHLEHLNDSPLNYCVSIQSRLVTEAERQIFQESLKDRGTFQNDTNSEAVPSSNKIDFSKFPKKCGRVLQVPVSQCQCASRTAGSTIELTEAVFEERLNNGFIFIRPQKQVEYDNVAFGARSLIEKHGVKRILIVDLGGHHDTQRIFYEDDRILYFSIQNDSKKSFETSSKLHSEKNNFDDIGFGKGKGFNVNLSLNEESFSDSNFFGIFFQILFPMAFEFNPQMVILSTNFATSTGFQKACGRVTPALFGHLTHSLMSLAGGKIAVVFQSSNFSASISQNAICMIEALLGYPCQPLSTVSRADTSTVAAILNLIDVLKSHWKCFKFQGDVDVSVEKNFDQNKKSESKSKSKLESKLKLELELESKLELELESKVKNEIQKTGSDFQENFRKINIKNRTCVVYDDLMLGHDEGLDGIAGPEIPGRLTSIFGHLKKTSLIEKCLMVESRDVLPTELELIHSEFYVKLLHLQPTKFAAETEKRKERKTKLKDRWPDDIWATKGTQPAILRAAGSLLSVVDAVLTGESLNGFAIIRPPGHHAHLDHPAGFCFANNVAIAAKYATQKYGLKKILIVDWDVHHGDGSQEVFYQDPSICYVSLHRGEEEFYPEGKQKSVKFTGSGKGQGYNINIPWQQPRMTDGDYVSAFLQLVMPVAYEFAPELVLVSCGFDAALGDPLGGCCVTEIGYAIMTRMVAGLAGGRVILALEGGYNLKMLAKCSGSVVRALLGLEMEVIPKPLVPSSVAVQDIKRAIDAQLSVPQRPWQSLQYRVNLHDLTEDKGDRRTSLRNVPVSVNSSVDNDTDKLTSALQNVHLEK